MSNEEEIYVMLAQGYLETKAPKKCRECFCNELCIYTLIKTGQVTTCENWQAMVRKIVDKEQSKTCDTCIHKTTADDVKALRESAEKDVFNWLYEMCKKSSSTIIWVSTSKCLGCYSVDDLEKLYDKSKEQAK